MTALTILLLASELADIGRIRAAFSESPRPLHLQVVQTEGEALAFLQQRDPYARMPRPDFIVLDGTVPPNSRRAMVTALRQDPQLKHLPVVLLPAQIHSPLQTKSSNRRRPGIC